jgi:ABC-type phosphate/phosphonate transport system ATPase subunit
VKWSIGSCSIVEIVGRANGGKSYLLNEMIVECIKAKQKIIYLDSNQNFEKLSLRIAQELQTNSDLHE